MSPRVGRAHAGLAGLAVLALGAVVLVSEKIGTVGLEGTYTYTANVPVANPDAVYSYQTSTPGDNTYTYTTSMAGDNTYTYSTAMAPAEQTFTYNTNMGAAAPDAYTYTTAAAPQDNTYTYLAGPQAAEPNEYTYTANAAGGPALYTYDASSPDAGLSTYNAQEVNSQMTTINGYVQDDKPEQWWNVPMGELHPLDTAGAWDSGAVNAINPDSTVRSSAPLTLTGERADGTVASEDSTRPPPEDRLKAARTTQLLQMPELWQRKPLTHPKMHAQKFNALAVAKGAHLNKATLNKIYKTPVGNVGRLSKEERKLWASHVILQAKKQQMRRMVFHTPVAQVKSLPKKEQKQWAQHVLAQSKLHWANGASRLVNRELHPKRISDKKGLRNKHSIAIEPLPSRGRAGKVDTFGMPELRGAWSGGMVPQTTQEISNELNSKRPCGLLCHQRAVSAVRGMLPTSDGSLSGLADDGILPRMPVS